MQGRWTLIAIGLAAALLGCVAPFPSASAADPLTINVVSAASHGCSPDSFTSPDLRVTVRLAGQVALQSAKAQDNSAPLYAIVTTVVPPSSPVEATIQVEEAEPGGLFFGTTWVQCDTAPGPDQIYSFMWSGSTTTVVALGDGDHAAEATVVFGSGAPTAPQVSVGSITPDSATLSWDEQPTLGHRVAWGSVGWVFADVPPGGSSHTLSNLCENARYTVRVVRDLSPWHVGSTDTTFTTANLPPNPPRILSAQPNNGSVALRVDLPTSHDLARIDVFGGDTQDVSLDGSPLLSESRTLWSSTWTGNVPSSPTYLRVRVTDNQALSAASDAFAVGGPTQSAGSHDQCPVQTSAAPPPSPPSPSASGSTSTSSSTSSSASSTSSSSSSSASLAPVLPRSTSSSSTGSLPQGGLLGDDGSGARPDSEPTKETDSSPFPINAWTLGLMAVAAVLAGAVIGLVLRHRR